MGDEAKRIILARRARFVAAALAGLNAATCGGESTSSSSSPKSCLDIAVDASPQPCLSPRQKDSGEPDAGEAGPSDASDASDGG